MTQAIHNNFSSYFYGYGTWILTMEDSHWQTGVAITLYTRIWEVLGLNLGQDTGYTD
jgi:hypothetical protein